MDYLIFGMVTLCWADIVQSFTTIQTYQVGFKSGLYDNYGNYLLMDIFKPLV